LVPIPLAGAVICGSYTGGLLPWLDGQFSLAWLGVIAVPVAAFAAAYASTEAPAPELPNDRRPRVLRRLGGARLLALAMLCMTVSFLKVLAGFIDDRDSSVAAEAATWWAVPFALCFLVLAAVAIARETEQAGTGVPADPERQWRWLVSVRERQPARVVAYLLLFVGTLTFTAVGSIPGLIWRNVGTQLPSWQGHSAEPVSVWYVAFFLWAGAVAVTAMVYLMHAFRARPAGLPHAELRRAWYAAWAAPALVLVLGLFVAAGRGLLSEPVLDFALALYALVLVLMIVDASATTRHRRVKSSVPRRVVGAAIVIGFSIVAVLALQRPPFAAAVLAGCIAGLVTLMPTTLRALYGIVRLPPIEVDAVIDGDHAVPALFSAAPERAALNELLAVGSDSDSNAELDKAQLAMFFAGLSSLRRVRLPEGRNVPNSHTLVYLLFTCDDGLRGTKTWKLTDEMTVLLERLFPDDLDEQKHALIDLMRITARSLTATNKDVLIGTAPSGMEMVEAECVARLPDLPDDPDERRRWTRLREMRLAWLFGKAEAWTGAAQDVEPSPLQGKYNQTHGADRSAKLREASEVILTEWLARLQAVLAHD
jgi:hypothetical protein